VQVFRPRGTGRARLSRRGRSAAGLPMCSRRGSNAKYALRRIRGKGEFQAAALDFHPTTGRSSTPSSPPRFRRRRRDVDGDPVVSAKETNFTSATPARRAEGGITFPASRDVKKKL